MGHLWQPRRAKGMGNRRRREAVASRGWDMKPIKHRVGSSPFSAITNEWKYNMRHWLHR